MVVRRNPEYFVHTGGERWGSWCDAGGRAALCLCRDVSLAMALLLLGECGE